MYLDAVGERQMPMSVAHAFWLETLRDYALDQPIPLPFDRQRPSAEHRTGRGASSDSTRPALSIELNDV